MNLPESSWFASVAGGGIAGLITGGAASGFIAGAFGAIIGIAVGVFTFFGSIVVAAIFCLAASGVSHKEGKDSAIENVFAGLVFVLILLAPFVSTILTVVATLNFVS